MSKTPKNSQQQGKVPKVEKDVQVSESVPEAQPLSDQKETEKIIVNI